MFPQSRRHGLTGRFNSRMAAPRFRVRFGNPFRPVGTFMVGAAVGPYRHGRARPLPFVLAIAILLAASLTIAPLVAPEIFLAAFAAMAVLTLGFATLFAKRGAAPAPAPAPATAAEDDFSAMKRDLDSDLTATLAASADRAEQTPTDSEWASRAPAFMPMESAAAAAPAFKPMELATTAAATTAAPRAATPELSTGRPGSAASDSSAASDRSKTARI